MALRANATAGNFIARTASMPNWAAFTVGGILRIRTDLNTNTAFMQIKDSSARFLAMYTAADGTSIELFDDYGATGTNGVAIRNLTVDNIYGVAIRCTTGRAAKMYVYDHSNSTMYTNGGTMDAAYTGALSELRLGNYAYGSACNAAFEGWKFWGAALSDAEVEQELKFINPIVTANLIGHWPMSAGTKAGCLVDSTATGDFVETGTAFTQEAGAGVALSPLSLAVMNHHYRMQGIA